MQLTLVKDAVKVKDLESANGTYVNNKRIQKEQPLSPGDHLVVGPVVFTVQINGQPAEIRAVKTKLRPLTAGAKSAVAGDSGAAKASGEPTEEVDPISALEALASSTDQTAIDPFDGEEIV